jgi:DNA primase
LLNTARCLSRAYGLSDQLTRLNVHPRAEQAPAKRSTIAVAKPIGLPAEYEVFGDADDPVEQAARQYLAARRISVLQIIRHKIGYAACGPMAWRVLFPVFGEDQRIYGCVGRAIQQDIQPKYLNTATTKLLWNAHREGSYAVVCEGIVDALMVEQALLSTKDAVAVARLGSSVTPLQLKQLRKYSKVVILPDWDVAGTHGALDFARRCDEVGIQTWVAIPGEMNDLDPGSMSEQQILDQLANAQPFCEQKPHTAWRLRASAVKVH